MSQAYLEQEEVVKLEQAAEYLRDKLLIRLLFHLGCRVSEALGLRVEDIDFKKGTVTIEHLKTRLNLLCPECSTRLGKRHKYCPVCGIKVEQAVSQAQEHHRYRKLPVDQETLALLKEYLRLGGATAKQGGQGIFNLCRHRAWQISPGLCHQSTIAQINQTLKAEKCTTSALTG